MPIGPWELAIILVIVIIIFGAGKLPEIGGALGRGIREFKQSAREEEEPEETQPQYPQNQQYAHQPQHEPAQQYHAEPQPQPEQQGSQPEQQSGGEPARRDA
jgi:sec-independent protein translocase protein TatA